MPQMSTDCLGLLLFCLEIEDPIHAELAKLYVRNTNPVAFFDESFETEADDTFYVIAVAIVDHNQLAHTRRALDTFYGGAALHAAPMYARNELETLRQATELVSRHHDGMDIVVCAPIGASRDAARAACLSFAAAKVHTEFGTSLFVLDSLGTPTENKLDQRTFHDLRAAPGKALHRDTVAVHCRPSEELLLGLPDVVAWAYRQERVRNDRTWFEPLREFTEVTVLN